MTKAEVQRVSVGDIVFRVDCFGYCWAAKVGGGNKCCLNNPEKEIGIDYIYNHPDKFSRDQKEAYRMFFDLQAERRSVMFG